jgi:hypothetical protein
MVIYFSKNVVRCHDGVFRLPKVSDDSRDLERRCNSAYMPEVAPTSFEELQGAQNNFTSGEGKVFMTMVVCPSVA